MGLKRFRAQETERRGEALRKVVVGLGMALALACLGFAACVLLEYHAASKVYDDVRAAAFPEGLDASVSLADMRPDWEALRTINSDVVGWIVMPGTGIDYPIVQGQSDAEYLRKSYLGDAGGFVMEGSIFLSELNKPDFSDGGNFIYGHNMNDGSMFAPVYQMVADPSCLAGGAEFFVLSPGRNYRCEVYAADAVPREDTGILVTDLEDAEARSEYVRARLAEDPAFAAPDAETRGFGKLFTLVTCTDLAATTRSALYGGSVEEAVPAGT